MASVRCPVEGCRNRVLSLPDNYTGTVQCDQCANILHVVIEAGRAVDVRLRKLSYQVPPGLPSDLEKILFEAIACFDAGSNAATVVLAGLFIEGLLTKAGMHGDRLVDMIEEAHAAEIVSRLGFHMATASRLIRNMGAHYSEDLSKLTEPDARLVLEM